ncbi:hypothetical protein LCGC14_2954430, partial [marine sediment metagenome]
MPFGFLSQFYDLSACSPHNHSSIKKRNRSVDWQLGLGLRSRCRIRHLSTDRGRATRQSLR